MKRHKDMFHPKIIIFLIVLVIVFLIGFTININRNASEVPLEEKITQMALASSKAQEVIKAGEYTTKFTILSKEKVLELKQEHPEVYEVLPEKQLYQVDVKGKGTGYRIILDEEEIYKEIFLSIITVGNP